MVTAQKRTFTFFPFSVQTIGNFFSFLEIADSEVTSSIFVEHTTGVFYILSSTLNSGIEKRQNSWSLFPLNAVGKHTRTCTSGQKEGKGGISLLKNKQAHNTHKKKKPVWSTNRIFQGRDAQCTDLARSLFGGYLSLPYTLHNAPTHQLQNCWS
jgi:hypothetical protein